MAYMIAEPWIGTKDAACVDLCPVDCIHPAKNREYHGGPESQGTKNFDEVPQLYINPQECIDCGASVPVCPVTAIFPLEDLPEKWANYTQSMLTISSQRLDRSRSTGRAYISPHYNRDTEGVEGLHQS